MKFSSSRRPSSDNSAEEVVKSGRTGDQFASQGSQAKASGAAPPNPRSPEPSLTYRAQCGGVTRLYDHEIEAWMASLKRAKDTGKPVRITRGKYMRIGFTQWVSDPGYVELIWPPYKRLWMSEEFWV